MMCGNSPKTFHITTNYHLRFFFCVGTVSVEEVHVNGGSVISPPEAMNDRRAGLVKFGCPSVSQEKDARAFSIDGPLFCEAKLVRKVTIAGTAKIAPFTNRRRPCEGAGFAVASTPETCLSFSFIVRFLNLAPFQDGRLLYPDLEARNAPKL